jgi:type VI secretion system protein VasJ
VVTERSELGRTPIPGDSPAGQPLIGDDDFEVLRTEVSRDPVLGVPVDWAVVAERGQRILAEKSKDFAVACYLAVALTQREGLRGLHDGLGILRDLTEAFWESGFPPVPARLRGRVNALGWLSERGAPPVNAIEPEIEDAEQVAACNQLFSELWKVTGERCEGHELALGDLASALRELAERVPRAAEPAAPAVQTRTSEGASPQAVSPAAPAASEIRSRSDVESLLLRISAFIREQDVQDPLAYRLPLIVAWSELRSEPPADGGKLMIPGPPGSQLSNLRSLRAASDWPGLQELAESVSRESPLFLDACRYQSEALAALGGPYRAAADGIRDELRSLVRRAPRLIRLQFSDGTPLADADTQHWLDEGSGAAGDAAAATASAEIDPDELEAARREARELARDKQDLRAALARLERTLAADASSRGRFLARLELAELCAATGHDRVAAPILSELDETLARHGLEHWEPALSRRVLGQLYQCLRRLAGASDAPEPMRARAEQIYERLCRLDPVEAAALE